MSGPAAQVWAAGAPVAGPSGDTIIYPQGAPAGAARPDEPKRPGAGAAIVVVVFFLAAGGVWLWARSRGPAGPVLSRASTKLAIAETRSLGNRQYLIVAEYEQRKFLLGVCPGRIELLTPLDSSSSVQGEKP